MKVFILGVGDAFSAINYSTCFIVQSDDGFNLGVECPHPYLKILHDARKINDETPKIEDVDHFVITHLHSDHCGGLETLGFYKKFIEGKTLSLSLGWNDYHRFRDIIRHGMGTTIINEIITKVPEWEYFKCSFESSAGPFKIETRPTMHYIPSQALLIREGNKAIGFSGDTKFSPELIDWLNQADFILHETGPAPGHTPLEHLVALPKELKRKIRLIHYSDALVTDEFRKAKQGETIYIG
jgi:ribonuclease BN (tRNA processing enzyme)